MKITIASVGKSAEPAIQQLAGKYLKRLAFYAEVEEIVLKDETKLLKPSKQARSGARHLLILLDSRGKQFSSEELAAFLGAHRDRGSASLLFAVGPANGFSDPLLKSAALRISLGKMTLTHELARVVLLEQLYRAFTILKGHPYHVGH